MSNHLRSWRVCTKSNQIAYIRLTFHISSASFTFNDAIQYLDGFNGGVGKDEVTLMQRISFKQPISQSIKAFNSVESEFDNAAHEKLEVHQRISRRHT